MKLDELADKIPVLDHSPFDGSERVYSVFDAKVVMVYPLTGKREPQVGFVFGFNDKRDLLFFSRYGIEDEHGVYACNSHDISLPTKFIVDIRVENFD